MQFTIIHKTDENTSLSDPGHKNQNRLTVMVPILERYQRQEAEHYSGTPYSEKVFLNSQKLYKMN